eukprot:gb/GECG01015761.1/.p1 GENE.gb/GECG01015761.1/~~gb/GECG01015761.1/.p1  ORF type:complete len:584 (+),score=64.03 gb/GECG01015761.1/:1-1752(+)
MGNERRKRALLGALSLIYYLSCSSSHSFDGSSIERPTICSSLYGQEGPRYGVVVAANPSTVQEQPQTQMEETPSSHDAHNIASSRPLKQDRPATENSNHKKKTPHKPEGNKGKPRQRSRAGKYPATHENEPSLPNTTWKSNSPVSSYWRVIVLAVIIMGFYMMCSTPQIRTTMAMFVLWVCRCCLRPKVAKPQIKKDVVFPYSVSLDVGRRPYMEDRHTVAGKIAGLENASVYAVFDGHGGDRAAEFASQRLVKTLEACIAQPLRSYSEEMQHHAKVEFERSTHSDDEGGQHTVFYQVANGLVTMFKALDTAWLKVATSTTPPMDEGTTAVVAVVVAPPTLAGCRLEAENIPESDSKGKQEHRPKSRYVTRATAGTQVWVANAGDSRAIVIKDSGEPVLLTEDHKPNRQDESARIRNLGGIVQFFGVWRVQGVLAVSRAIGDRLLKPFVTATPEVKSKILEEEDKYLVLATDGLWDVVSNAEVGAFLTMSNRSVQKAADLLTQEALSRGSTDNITVIIVDLKRRRKTVSHGSRTPNEGTGQARASQGPSHQADELVQSNPPRESSESSADARQRNISSKESPR